MWIGGTEPQPETAMRAVEDPLGEQWDIVEQSRAEQSRAEQRRRESRNGRRKDDGMTTGKWRVGCWIICFHTIFSMRRPAHVVSRRRRRWRCSGGHSS